MTEYEEEDYGSDSEEAEVMSPAEMLQSFKDINVLAPMVRYGKLSFRQTVSKYDVQITTSPMMLAKEFSRSSFARDADFSTNVNERGTFYLADMHSSTPSISSLAPLAQKKKNRRKIRGCLVAQFAASDPVHLADATELIAPHVDAIEVNCGCPQRWAYQEGIGSFLLRQPESVRDLVKTTKARVGQSFPVHVKIRVDDDLNHTDQLVRTAIHAGADVVSVHGRTRHQSSSGHPVNLPAIKFAVEAAKGQVPVVANGDVFSLAEARLTRRECGVNGVMSARGLLANPALFSGFDSTPKSAVQEFIDHSMNSGLIYPLFHRHVVYMLENSLRRKADRTFLNSLASHASVLNYLEEEGFLT